MSKCSKSPPLHLNTVSKEEIPSTLPVCASLDTPVTDSDKLGRSRAGRKQRGSTFQSTSQQIRMHALHSALPGFEVYCIAIMSIEDADRLT